MIISGRGGSDLYAELQRLAATRGHCMDVVHDTYVEVVESDAHPRGPEDLVRCLDRVVARERMRTVRRARLAVGPTPPQTPVPAKCADHLRVPRPLVRRRARPERIPRRLSPGRDLRWTRAACPARRSATALRLGVRGRPADLDDHPDRRASGRPCHGRAASPNCCPCREPRRCGAGWSRARRAAPRIRARRTPVPGFAKQRPGRGLRRIGACVPGDRGARSVTPVFAGVKPRGRRFGRLWRKERNDGR